MYRPPLDTIAMMNPSSNGAIEKGDTVERQNISLSGARLRAVRRLGLAIVGLALVAILAPLLVFVEMANAQHFSPSHSATQRMAQGTVQGVWKAAANTPDPSAAMILLPNGKVFVGADALLSGNPSYLYDPSTDTWSHTALLHKDIINDAYALIGHGDVLIAGGDDPFCETNCFYSSAELYHPSTNTWSSGGSLSVARSGASATTLSNGDVLVAGGYDNEREAIYNKVDIYHTSTRTWSRARSMLETRLLQQALLLRDGRVFVFGGYTSNTSRTPSQTTELYNPVTNSWTMGAPMPDSRQFYTATLLLNGEVLIVGGSSATSTPGLLGNLLYNPVTNSWSHAANLATPRAFHTATLLPTGDVLVAGGLGSHGLLSDAQLYHVATNSWSSAGMMPTIHADATALVLPDGRVYINGGNTAVLSQAKYPFAPAQTSHRILPQLPPSTGPIYAAVIYSTAPGIPGAPHAVAGNGFATVSWGAPSSDGSPITSYTVTAEPGGKAVIVGGATHSVTFTGLTNGVSYTFTVFASNALGAGPASSTSNQVTPTQPATPTSPSTGANGQGGADTPTPTANAATPQTGEATPTPTSLASGASNSTTPLSGNGASQPNYLLIAGLAFLAVLVIGGGFALLLLRRGRTNL